MKKDKRIDEQYFGPYSPLFSSGKFEDNMNFLHVLQYIYVSDIDTNLIVIATQNEPVKRSPFATQIFMILRKFLTIKAGDLTEEEIFTVRKAHSVFRHFLGETKLFSTKKKDFSELKRTARQFSEEYIKFHIFRKEIVLTLLEMCFMNVKVVTHILKNVLKSEEHKVLRNKLFREIINSRKKEKIKLIKCLSFEIIEDIIIKGLKDIDLQSDTVKIYKYTRKVLPKKISIKKLKEKMEINDILKKGLTGKKVSSAQLKKLAFNKKDSDIAKELIRRTKGIKLLKEKKKTLSNISQLQIEDTEITEIIDLHYCVNLRFLVFQGNNIRKIENLENLKKLTNINLMKNKIEKIENLEMLSNLEKLNLSFNKISKLENLYKNYNLYELKIHNQDVNSFKIVPNSIPVGIKRMNLSHNHIVSVSPLILTSGLLDLDISYNDIMEIKEIRTILLLPMIERLFIRGNPIVETKKRFRDYVIENSGEMLMEIDGKEVEVNTRAFLQRRTFVRKLKTPKKTKEKKVDLEIRATRPGNGFTLGLTGNSVGSVNDQTIQNLDVRNKHFDHTGSRMFQNQ